MHGGHRFILVARTLNPSSSQVNGTVQICYCLIGMETDLRVGLPAAQDNVSGLVFELALQIVIVRSQLGCNWPQQARQALDFLHIVRGAVVRAILSKN